MNLSSIILFLKELAVNNNREWFNSRRDEYEKVQVEFENFLSVVISRISFFDETIKGVQAKDCTYRIYRDIRFSSDKTPYKTHIGGFINAKGKKSNHSGYYIHFEPGNCLLAGGSICMLSGLLKAVRQAIYENIDEYISIVEDPGFKKYFPVAGENFLKTAPKGFPKDFKYIDYLKCKDYSCSYNVADEFFLVPETEMLSNIESVFRQLKRFMDFVNYTIDDFEE
ncbi:hypothetical protein EZS27_001272 [termite gut metagenome]|uniref:TIGR02453 family protein n=1 Tax=termite gut metagenome TaxID=433724 RepID=A0A5J4SYK4_9ZZZZ